MNQIYINIVDALNMGVLLVDQNHKVVVWNRWLERVSTLQRTEVVGRRISDVCPCFRKSNYKSILDNAILYGQGRFCSGMLHSVFIYPPGMLNLQAAERQNMQVEAFHDGDEVFALIQINDITGQYKRVQGLQNMVKELEVDYELVKESEKQAKQIALYDDLTGLCNRTLFYDRLNHSIQQASRTKQLMALMFLDLDGFKAINDSYGHSQGDRLLQEVATRLKLVVRNTDTVCRLGGDEYTILLPDIKTKDHVEMIANKIMRALMPTFDLSDEQIVMTVSVGISLFPGDGIDLTTLVKNADSAMYAVKNSGKNGYQFY